MNQSLSSGVGDIFKDTYDYINALITNPNVVGVLFVLILLYVVLLSSSPSSSFDLSSSYSSSSSSSSSFELSSALLFFFLIIVMVWAIRHFHIVAMVRHFFTLQPEIDIIATRIDNPSSPVPEIKIAPQVFNIPNNDYEYQDAKALCSAYGSRLATYQEVEDAYQTGGEWCNYGWSDGQMALFPTQSKTFDALQKIEGHENDCGRPGINGGYMKNPALKFGVNCFGFKPRMTAVEEELMANAAIYPKTEKDLAMENRVNYWKAKLSEVMVSPFNHRQWSKI